MAGPWEKYQRQPAAQAGPWQAYRSAAAAGSDVDAAMQRQAQLPAAQKAAAFASLPPEIQQGIQERIREHAQAAMTPEAREARFQQINAQNVAAMNPLERIWTGVGEGAYNFWHGVKQNTYDRLADLVDGGGRVARDEANVGERRRLSQALNDTAGGKLGNLAGSIASTLPVALIPGLGEAGIGARMALAGAEGLGLGYVAPAASEGEHVGNTLGGLALGAVAPAAAGLGGRVLSGLATPEAKRLIAQGVKPSFGQMVGGAIGRTEQAMTSLPITGDVIQAARNRGIDTFNRTATNRVLAPIGEAVPEGPTLWQRLFGTKPSGSPARVATGQPSMAFAAGKASGAFNNALAGTRGVFDSQLGHDLASIINKAPPGVRGELTDAIQNGVLDKFSAADGALPGQAFNDLRSDLAKTAVRYRKSESATNRAVGARLGEVLDSLDSMFTRNNGQAVMDALADARQVYRGTMALKDATNAAGRTREGVFTPGEFLGAVKRNDATKGKAAFSRGQAFLQDLGNDAQAALGNTIGNSFTFDRLAHGTVPGWLSAPVGAPLAVPNLPGVRRVLQSILAPQIAPIARAQAAGALSHNGARVLVPVGSALLTQPPTPAPELVQP